MNNSLNDKKLKFQKGNAKLGKEIYTFSISSGWSCPFAKDCLSKADRVTGRITDGPHTQFRCFSASQEALYPSVRNARWYNFELLRESLKENNTSSPHVKCITLILNSLPKKADIIRIHVGGDFFSQAYFDAWMAVARMKPGVIFYAYTKSIKFWVHRLGMIPSNFKLNASYGGKDDGLIVSNQLKYAKVVYTVEEAEKLTLAIDHDDTHAYKSDDSFALLLHGVQAKGSIASKALSVLKKAGIGGYGKQKADRVMVGA